MEIKWIACQDGEWCGLNQLNLCGTCFEDVNGVYLIWHRGAPPSIVRVGYGNIGERLAAEKADADVQQYAPLNLCVTWAVVDQRSRDGVAAWLAQTLKPLAALPCPDCAPIVVNLPWN